MPVGSRLLGHSSVSMTLRYAHLGDRDIKAAAERVGQYIGSKLGLEYRPPSEVPVAPGRQAESRTPDAVLADEPSQDDAGGLVAGCGAVPDLVPREGRTGFGERPEDVDAAPVAVSIDGTDRYRERSHSPSTGMTS